MWVVMYSHQTLKSIISPKCRENHELTPYGISRNSWLVEAAFFSSVVPSDRTPVESAFGRKGKKTIACFSGQAI